MPCTVCGATPPPTIHREALQRAWVTNHTKREHTPKPLAPHTQALIDHVNTVNATAKAPESHLCARCGSPTAKDNLNHLGLCSACQSGPEGINAKPARAQVTSTSGL
jgi:hypothetical protein